MILEVIIGIVTVFVSSGLWEHFARQAGSNFKPSVFLWLLVEPTRNFFYKLGTGLVWISSFYSHLKIFFGNFFKNLLIWLNNAWTALTKFLGELFTNFAIWLGNAWDALTKFLGDMFTSFFTWLGNAWDTLTKFLGDMFTSFFTWLGNVWTSIVKFFGELSVSFGELVEPLWKLCKAPFFFFKGYFETAMTYRYQLLIFLGTVTILFVVYCLTTYFLVKYDYIPAKYYVLPYPHFVD